MPLAAEVVLLTGAICVACTSIGWLNGELALGIAR
jgi:hypothetical protein